MISSLVLLDAVCTELRGFFTQQLIYIYIYIYIYIFIYLFICIYIYHCVQNPLNYLPRQYKFYVNGELI